MNRRSFFSFLSAAPFGIGAALSEASGEAPVTVRVGDNVASIGANGISYTSWSIGCSKEGRIATLKMIAAVAR